MRRALKILVVLFILLLKLRQTNKKKVTMGVLFYQENCSIKSEITIMFLFMFLFTMSVVLSGKSLIKGDIKNVRKLSFF